MAQREHFIDGRSALAQQQDQINFIETIAFSEILTFTKLPGANGPLNRAVFDDVPLTAEHKDIELVEIGPTDNPGSIIASKIAAGKAIVFHTQIFIDSEDRTVVGFR
jgi:hypothetical protein